MTIENALHLSLTSTRRFYNPIQRDAATFIETSTETRGVRSLIEIELAPNGKNVPHTHTLFSERFKVLEGTIQVQLGKEHHILKIGESITAPAGTVHCFSNPTNTPARFLVELQPGHTGFEQALQIMYGLAADGKTNRAGIPKNFYHLAVIYTLGESKVTGMLRLLLPIVNWVTARARAKGIERQLIDTYCLTT